MRALPFLPRYAALASFLLLAGSASAQSFNVDLGNAPTPGNTFAAAGVAGTWNLVGTAAGTSAPLADIAGNVTTVTVTTNPGGTVFTSTLNMSGASSNDISLMADIFNANTNAITFTIANLAAGDYDVYTYAMAPDNPTFRTNCSVTGSPDGTQAVGGNWPNMYVQGVTHAKHHVTVAPAATLVIHAVVQPSPPGPATNLGSIAGFQLVATQPLNGIAFCAGDAAFVDHTTACPCGNNGATGNGCGHSFDPNGANLSATGSVTADDIVLHSRFEPASSFTLMMQHANPGDAVFHDGVLCASNPLIRLRGRPAVAGEAFFPNSNFAQDSTTTLSLRGGVTPGSGATRFYAAWYRNASATFCPPATANVTNGWRLTW